MAGKSRRVAARQSQLNRRRKKQQRGPSGIPTAVPEPANVATGIEGEIGAESAAAPEPARSSFRRPTAPASSGHTPSSDRSPARLRADSAPAYQYIGSEIRRIVAMAGTAFAVLVVLKFVL